LSPGVEKKNTLAGDDAQGNAADERRRPVNRE
jgi:hypothetical protein